MKLLFRRHHHLVMLIFTSLAASCCIVADNKEDAGLRGGTTQSIVITPAAAAEEEPADGGEYVNNPKPSVLAENHYSERRLKTTNHELAVKFSPQMRFDQKASQFPMPASQFWAMSTFDDAGNRVLPAGTPFSSPFEPEDMGLSYTVIRCEENRTKIVYWAFYKGQQPCFTIWLPFVGTLLTAGDHEGDWERIVVDLTQDETSIYQVVFHQHGGYYTRAAPGNMEIVDGTHPVSYVGKNSNGQYHDDGGSGGCLYYEDFRNTGKSGKVYSSWEQGVLIPTQTDDPWNTFKGSWGRDGFKGPITKDEHDPSKVCNRNHCGGDVFEGCHPGKSMPHQS